MEATKFTWFPKLTNTLNEIAKDFPELVGEFALAVSNYGTFGIMPEFSNIALKYAFFGVKDDIDNSINARKNGKRGGQNKGGSAPTEGGLETSQGGLNTSEGGLDTLEEPVKGGSAPTEAPYTVNQTIPVHTKPVQTNPNHTKPNQTKEREGAKRKHFTPPTPTEVDVFAKTLDYCPPGFDPQRFCDYYAAQGWKLANGNTMKDWKAAVRNWIKRDIPQKTEKEEKLDAVYAEYGAVYDANTVYFDEL